MKVSAPTAEMSGVVQRLLLAHGARYDTRLGEADWRAAPVRLVVDETEGARFPPGDWLVLPWDSKRADKLESWLSKAASQGRRLPRYTVLVTSLGHVAEAWLVALGERLGTQMIAVQVATGTLTGPADMSAALGPVFDRDARKALQAVNPLDHLCATGDPRDRVVFIERLRRSSSGAVVTRGLIAMNVLIYVAMLLVSGFDLFGGFSLETLTIAGADVYGLTVGDRQWWRLLACVFLHANLIHIAMNMWALHALGETAERLFGSAMFTALYVLAGLGGSVASLAFTLAGDPSMPSVGASGAVFGVMGGLMGFVLRQRGTVPPSVYRGLTRSGVLFTGLNVAIGFSMPSIDNAAHLGGLVTGLVCGLLMSRALPPAPQPSLGSRVAASALVFGALAAAFATL